MVKQAEPDVVEEWKWRGVPVWERDGIICTGETYKNYVKASRARRCEAHCAVNPLVGVVCA